MTIRELKDLVNTFSEEELDNDIKYFYEYHGMSIDGPTIVKAETDYYCVYENGVNNLLTLKEVDEIYNVNELISVDIPKGSLVIAY